MKRLLQFAPKWRVFDEDNDLCPKCGEFTEHLLSFQQRENDEEPHDYDDGERCIKCGWEVRH